MQQIKKALPIRVEVTSILKKAIYSREYNAGDELSLTDMAEKLGISRTPVREAFQSLAEEGLITLRMNRGAVVNSIDRKFIRDCFEMRILLESEAAGRSAENGMTTEDLLTQLYAMSENAGETDRETYERLNEDIHMRLWDTAGNEKLKRYLMELWNGPSTGHSIAESSQHYTYSTAEHIEILEAVRDHKPEIARQAMTKHITRSMHNILAKYPE
ncbi:MAG: GntR family transcriptional regulator [Synergistaceae bacterium]|nr:GntR family transcriptional regulator [Synergistaceae bacterium]